MADWLTHGGDPQRTGWQKYETVINKESVKGFQLLWKLKLENEQKAMYSIFEPLIMGRIITNRGFKEMAYVGGSSDNIYAVDADLGRILWQRHFDHAADVPQTQNPTWLCPGGLTATPVIPPPPTFGGRQGGGDLRHHQLRGSRTCASTIRRSGTCATTCATGDLRPHKRRQSA